MSGHPIAENCTKHYTLQTKPGKTYVMNGSPNLQLNIYYTMPIILLLDI